MSRSVAARIGVFVIALGATFPLQQVALHYWPPVLLVGVRGVLGGLLMMGLSGFSPAAGRDLARLRHRVGLLVVPAICNVVLVAVGIIYAVRLLTGGEASLLAYTQPLFFALLARSWLGEAPHRGQTLALVVGFVGVALVTLPFGSVRFNPWGVLAGLGAGVSWAVGVTYLRRASGRGDAAGLERRRFLALLGGPQFVLGGLVLVVVGSLTESWAAVRWTPEALLSAGFFTLCGALGWLAYLALVEETPVGRIASWSFGVPLVANVAGVVFLHEHMDLAIVLGGVAVLVGIVLVEASPRTLPE